MAVHEDSREDQPDAWTPHTEGQQGLRGGWAEQGEALPDTTGRSHRIIMQKMNAGASSCVVLMCLIVIVMGMELMCPDNPFALESRSKDVGRGRACQLPAVPLRGKSI